MKHAATRLLVMAAMMWTALAANSVVPPVAAVQADPATRVMAGATNYLAVEVPRWRREHPCYSCHNNGDGARALIAASRKGLVQTGQFADAVSWLRTPDRWSSNSADGGVKDLPLSRIQFAAALQGLVAAGAASQDALDIAATLVAADQRADGSWPISATSNIGTPSGYGTPLATAIATSVLRSATTAAARAATQRADGWFRGFTPEAVLEASAVLLGLGESADEPAVVARRRALEILKNGQGPDGGWGPYPSSQSEVFDTAVGMLALRAFRRDPSRARPVFTEQEWRSALDRGRQFLIERQETDGSWAETTRPALQESYSQRVSTTAWALLALIEE